MPTPHQLTIDVLDAFGSVVGTAVVAWADTKWSEGAIDEAHRQFGQPHRLPVPPDPEDARMIWSLRTTLAG